MNYLADFCAWFQRQLPSSRLEMLVTLLQMLHPLELRFVGACVEELARKDYYRLREYEIRSNSGPVVAQLGDLSDPICRGRMVVALSLLYSGNYAASAVLYRILLNLSTIFHQLPKTKEVLDEIILLLVMAKHHPAFKFDQRADIAVLLEKIESMAQFEENVVPCTIEEKSEESVEIENACSMSVSKPMVDRATQVIDVQELHCCTCRASGGTPSGDSGLLALQPKADFLTNIAVKGTRKSENENVYDLQITWSNGEQTEVSKTMREMYEFHRQLLDWYPRDAGSCGSGRKIPYFPGYRDGSAGEAATPENVSKEVRDYIKDLVKLSPEILRSEYTVNFFKITSPMASPPLAEPTIGASASCLPTPTRPNVLVPGSSGPRECVDSAGGVATVCNSHITSEDVGLKDEPRTENKTSLAGRPKNETQSSSLRTSKHASKKSQVTSNARSSSPSQKTFDSTSATSQTSTDLVQSVSTVSSASGSGGQTNARKSSTSSLSSFIPNPLYSILKNEGVIQQYKQFLDGRPLEELCTMTDSDLVKAGLPLEPCLAVINGVKNFVYASTKQINGTVPKFNASDVVGDMVLPLMSPAGHYRSTPPIRSASLGPDGMPIPLVAPIATVGVPYVSVGGTLSVDTGMHGRINFVDGNGLVNQTSGASFVTPKPSESSAATDISISTTPLNQIFHLSNQPKLMLPLSSEMVTSTSSHDPSVVSSWIQPSSEEEFQPVGRSYSLDAGDPIATTTNMANFNSTSTSLPPSQSQSPAPTESQQQPYCPTAPGIMSTSATFPVQHGDQQRYHQPHQHQQKNSKSSHRSSVSLSKVGMPHLPNTMQRRSYAPAFDYSRAQHQQQPFASFIAHHQPMAAHAQMAAATIPAATFVRAPPPAASSAVPPQQCLRFVCQQCNGTSTNCSLCHGNWSNGLLASTNRTAAGGPFLFHLATTRTGPPPQQQQLFSPAYFTTPPGTNPLAPAQFFGAPPAGFRLSTVITSPVILKSASASLVPGDQQHAQAIIDQQQLQRSMGTESILSLPVAGSSVVMESCCNCGLQGHTRDGCVELTLDDLTSSGHFHLNLAAKEDSASTSQDR